MATSKSGLKTSAPVSWLSPTEWSALEDYVEKVRARHGDQIHQIILFGSRVRGEGNEESDLDVAVILKAEDRHVRRELVDTATEVWLETEIRISPLVLSREEFQKLLEIKRGIAVAIQSEGKVL